MIKNLQEKHNVHFLYIGKEEFMPPNELNDLKAAWKERIHFYFPTRFNLIRIIKRIYYKTYKKIYGFNHLDDLYPHGLTQYVNLLNQKFKFDYVVINYITLSKLFIKHWDFKKVMLSHDVFSYKTQRLNVDSFWYNITPNDEAKGLRRCDTILAMQDKEANYFDYLYPHSTIKTTYCYNEIVKHSLTNNSNILFFSGKSQLNINGILFFIKDIWPLVVSKYPSAQLIIGGNICESLKDITDKHIKMIGRIDDETNFYSMGDIVINPIYQGTGIKIKTFESLAHGRVTIVHPHSAEGIFDIQNCPILIGKTPELYAQLILDFLCNKEKRVLYSKKALEYTERLNTYIQQQYINIFK